MKVEVNVGAAGVTLEDMCQELRLLYKELEFTVCTAGISPLYLLEVSPSSLRRLWIASYCQNTSKKAKATSLEMPDHAIEVMTNKHFAFFQKSIKSRKVMERHTKISLKDTVSTVSIIMLRPCYVLKSRHTQHIKQFLCCTRNSTRIICSCFLTVCMHQRTCMSISRMPSWVQASVLSCGVSAAP